MWFKFHPRTMPLVNLVTPGMTRGRLAQGPGVPQRSHRPPCELDPRAGWCTSQVSYRTTLKGQTHLLSPASDLEFLELAQQAYFAFPLKSSIDFHQANTWVEAQVTTALESKFVCRWVLWATVSEELTSDFPQCDSVWGSFTSSISPWTSLWNSRLEMTGHKSSPLLSTFYKPDTIQLALSHLILTAIL